MGADRASDGLWWYSSNPNISMNANIETDSQQFEFEQTMNQTVSALCFQLFAVLIPFGWSVI